jgi:transcriptional regulator with XRE-family HTH domain
MISFMRDSKDLASAIRKLRGARLQKEAAEKAGLDSSTWSVYEKGRRLPRDQDRVEQIARGLGCTLERLDEVIWECRNERIGEEKARAGLAQAPMTDPALRIESLDPLKGAIQTGFTNIRREVNEVLLALEEILVRAAGPNR